MCGSIVQSAVSPQEANLNSASWKRLTSSFDRHWTGNLNHDSDRLKLQNSESPRGFQEPRALTISTRARRANDFRQGIFRLGALLVRSLLAESTILENWS